MSKQSSGTSEEELGGMTEENPDAISGHINIEDFTKDGFKVLMESIRNSNALPSGRDWKYYSTFESFKEIMSHEGNRLQRMMNKLIHIQDIDGNIRNKLLDEKVELIIEANDAILEKVANNIDEMNGIKKNVIAPVEIQTVSAHLPINASWNRVTSATFSVSDKLDIKKNSPVNSIRLLTAKNIIRPQKFFKDKIDNSNRPWEPRITDKPNSLKPLAIFLEETENGEEFSHAYQFELEHFTPPANQLHYEDAVPPNPISETPLIEVTQPEQLDDLVEKLRNCQMFSVDLEHHSYRTFMGITCLMQISTQDTDYLIDTLALRDKLFILNEVFTKPTILKIFHGADMDIQWLQRDLSLYVVNMFDTHQAARTLEYSSLSLSFLLKKFCDFLPNKQFQLADWRMRPLPEELKSYAREDTHYLLYIYQMMKKELLQKGNGADNFLRSVFQKSTQVCLKRYMKPILREDSHMDLYRKCKRLFDNRQLYALKGLYKWRDELSRREDESTGYVLPNHMLLQISESLPREMQGILASCNPTPPLVKAHLLELHQIILRARDQPLEKAILREENRSRGSIIQFVKIDINSPLHCPHDLSNSGEFRDDLPTLINGKISNEIIGSVNIENIESRYSIFNVSRPNSEAKDDCKSKAPQIRLLTPYQRYKLARTFIQAENELAAAKLASEAAKSTEGGSQNDKTASEGNASLNSNKNTDVKTTERTDEERIASIRSHYLKLARQTSESQTREVILNYDDNTLEKPPRVEDTKKRKRESSPDDRQADSITGDITSESKESQTPRPSVFTRIAPKRTSSDAFGEDTNFSGKQNNFGNKRKNKNKKWKQDRSRGAQDSQHEHGDADNVNWKSTEQASMSGQEIDFRHHSRSGNQNYGNKNKNKQKFNKNQNKFSQGHTADESSASSSSAFTGKSTYNTHKNQASRKSDFQPFDYSSVDYKEFQGGAGSVQKNQQFKGTFKGRGKGRSGKGGNKSSAFENGRGRGRGRGRRGR